MTIKLRMSGYVQDNYASIFYQQTVSQQF